MLPMHFIHPKTWRRQARPDERNLDFWRRGRLGGISMKANFLVSCAVAAILSGSAVAANAAETVQTAAADQPNVGDIIVTAQRRDESIQKVPLTIQAFSGDT